MNLYQNSFIFIRVASFSLTMNPFMLKSIIFSSNPCFEKHENAYIEFATGYFSFIFMNFCRSCVSDEVCWSFLKAPMQIILCHQQSVIPMEKVQGTFKWVYVTKFSSKSTNALSSLQHSSKLLSPLRKDQPTWVRTANTFILPYDETLRYKANLHFS